ncbi:transposase [Actinoplanes xinjiangensis]|uniref:Putative transposase of IS4/5 family DUF4096 n=1 Tax=Actinoplanes xinjiangensis TaxID=512350 RepID=A0A316EAB5_9ACTN|nr:transposase [Actinoplanes xinjiangensis]PWK26279.1 putative transposase of IS4/5 family DUF4096 [Actinoplanes xinjiangensis]GIF45420.1 hypothetical protein Axi01nite_97310 [Actinoplanes xinjiangensis]
MSLPVGLREGYDLRETVNALFYQNRTGGQWALRPHDLPPWSAVYYHFGLWRDDGTYQADRKRKQQGLEAAVALRPGVGLSQSRAGRQPPSAMVLPYSMRVPCSGLR